MSEQGPIVTLEEQIAAIQALTNIEAIDFAMKKALAVLVCLADASEDEEIAIAAAKAILDFADGCGVR